MDVLGYDGWRVLGLQGLVQHRLFPFLWLRS